MRLLLLQNRLPHYRKPLYNALAQHYDLTVVHSGTPNVSSSDRFREVVKQARRVGPFSIRNWVGASDGRYDATVSMFDLHWPDCVLPPLWDRRRYGRWILWSLGYGRSQLARPARDWLASRADGVLLYGHRARDEMLSRGVPRRKLFVAANTVYIPNHEDYSDHAKTSLLYVGTLIKVKKVEALIDLFAQIRNRIPDNVRLDIVGDGPERARLVQRAQSGGLSDAVVFHGEVNDNDALARLFARAYACVGAGRVGLVVLHSFAYGVPVVTTPSEPHGPEFDNIVHGSNGIVCERRELADALVELCTDRQKACALGRAAYAWYTEERTIDTMVRGFRQAIEADFA